MTWTIEPTQKKSVVETTFWHHPDTDERLEFETGWRSGMFYITELDEGEVAPDDPEIVKNENGFCVYDYAYAELDNTWDGCWEDMVYIDKDGNRHHEYDTDSPFYDRMQELRDGWNEDSYSYLEENGWRDVDSETWIYGPLDVKVEEDHFTNV